MVDEKSQVQALPHPTAAADDPRPGRAADARLRPQRDDVAVRRAERRHREVIGKCYQRHRQQEFLKFLKELDAQVVREPGSKSIS